MSSLPVADAIGVETKRAIRVLGLDPAAAGPTGYGVVETDGRRCKMLDYGAFRVDTKRQKESAGAALHDIHSLICELIQKFEPAVMAVESIFSALNVRTALRLAEVRGVVLLAAAQHGVVVHSYSPREVKASVAGYGHADKRQIQLMVRALLSLSEMLLQDNQAADALPLLNRAADAAPAVNAAHIRTGSARKVLMSFILSFFSLAGARRSDRQSVR